MLSELEELQALTSKLLSETSAVKKNINCSNNEFNITPTKGMVTDICRLGIIPELDSIIIESKFGGVIFQLKNQNYSFLKKSLGSKQPQEITNTHLKNAASLYLAKCLYTYIENIEDAEFRKKHDELLKMFIAKINNVAITTPKLVPNKIPGIDITDAHPVSEIILQRGDEYSEGGLSILKGLGDVGKRSTKPSK